ncbi:hypothetical protein [Oceanobacillus kimchii]|nr:hypothetical protein [Oceanobacillus kimchii]
MRNPKAGYNGLRRNMIYSTIRDGMWHKHGVNWPVEGPEESVRL